MCGSLYWHAGSWKEPALRARGNRGALSAKVVRGASNGAILMTSHAEISTRCELRRRRLKDAAMRDVLFLVGGAIAYVIVAYVEAHASDDDLRLKTMMDAFVEEAGGGPICAGEHEDCHMQRPHAPQKQIIDAGFIVTKPLHAYLSRNRDVNDLLAMGNSLLVTVPLAYVAYVTVWRGDFRLSFRLIATHLFRTCCGWFTYLPPDPDFLPRFQECSLDNFDVNFLTFFSGHVATVVIIANHLYSADHARLAVCLHGVNWLQALRLLATRGHYSIDLIFGYVVAAFVSPPAERLGLHFSRGIPPELPGPVAAFELLVGARPRGTPNVPEESPRLEGAKARTDSAGRHEDSGHVQSETSVRIAVNIMADIAHMKRSESSPALTSIFL